MAFFPSLEGEQLIVNKVHKDAKTPIRGSSGAAGYDLCSVEDIFIPQGEHVLVPTGIRVIIPTGYYGRVAPRSGLTVKHGINIGAGVIDCDYRGEVKVVMFNHGEEDVTFTKGTRIAQLILERCSTPPVSVVSDELFDNSTTTRGSGGFGSTGTH